MLQIAAILLLASAATCYFNGSYPLSVPLPDGTLVLNCSDPAWVLGDYGCTSTCCTNAKGVLYLTFSDFCSYDLRANDSEMAVDQHTLNVQSDLCRFRGNAVVAPQLQLTANATAILNYLYAKDEQLRQEQRLFFALLIIGGHIGLPLLIILSILSRKPRRDLTFHNFCFTWVFSSIVFSIGLYRRGPASILYGTTLPFIHSDQECLIQAALITGAQMMTDTSMCALIIQLWLDIRVAVYGPRGSKQIRWTKAALVAAPYAALLAFLLPARLRVKHHSVLPAAIQGKFYCVLGSDTLFIPMYAIRLVILAVALFCDVCIIRILYRRWRVFRQYRDKGLRISLSLIVRLLLFYMYRVDAAIAYGIIIGRRIRTLKEGLNGFSTADFNSLDFVPVWINMLLAATPLVAFIVFGTNKEFLSTLMFWRRKPPFIPTPSNANIKASSESSASSSGVSDITRDEKIIEGAAL